MSYKSNESTVWLPVRVDGLGRSVPGRIFHYPAPDTTVRAWCGVDVSSKLSLRRPTAEKLARACAKCWGWR